MSVPNTTPRVAVSRQEKEAIVISVLDYRRILADNVSTDGQIIKRLQYIEALCRNIIRNEVKKYVKSTKK